MENLPPLNALRVFEAAARLGAFSRAAEELSVTQGAVSRQIRLLEDRLGLELFRRVGRRVHLTQEGRDYHATVRVALEAIAAKTAQLSRRSRRRRLVVSTVPSFAAKWLAPRLASWRAAAPDIDLRVIGAYEPADFARDGVDAAIRYGRGPWPGLHVERLAEEDLFPVCARDFAREHGLRGPADLLRVTLLDREMTEGWAEWFAAQGVTGADPAGLVRLRDASAAIEAALGGQGVALANTSLVIGDLAAGRLIRPVAGSLGSAFAYHFVCPEAALARPPVAAFRRWVVQAMAERPAALSAPPAAPATPRRRRATGPT
ncbi:transcriptional regulator GcvA [Roseomonas eburnea]|uniref:Transcriptional regulator GcvA n=1 Tax=Neoroseomonas eburnea TaxID=1346889 RepID=A0A9X9XG33_9PROT|nr:transcriptional regulator GcvA [Neoroseomonas eburnea]MBR0682669.1 transcriptional regulator GcvA [Neoroseomonas eburnea]